MNTSINKNIKNVEWMKYVYALFNDVACSKAAKKEFVDKLGLNKLIVILCDTHQSTEIKRMGCKILLSISEDPLYAERMCESGAPRALLCVIEYFRGEESAWNTLLLLSKSTHTSVQHDKCIKILISEGVVQAALRLLTMYGITGTCIYAAINILLEISSYKEGVACMMANNGPHVIRSVEENMYRIVRPGYGEIRHSKHYSEVLHAVRTILQALGIVTKPYHLVQNNTCCSIS